MKGSLRQSFFVWSCYRHELCRPFAFCQNKKLKRHFYLVYVVGKVFCFEGQILLITENRLWLPSPASYTMCRFTVSVCSIRLFRFLPLLFWISGLNSTIVPNLLWPSSFASVKIVSISRIPGRVFTDSYFACIHTLSVIPLLLSLFFSFPSLQQLVQQLAVFTHGSTNFVVLFC